MFLLAYFRTPAEALHLALSPDALNWTALNRNEPTRAGRVRDPFLVRDHDGLFHLLATGGWHVAGVVHATSRDLITWDEQEFADVMGSVPNTRNVWAPEAFWDSEADAWRLIWSSSVHADASRMKTDDWDHRIWSATTRDWKSFSPPEIFFDPGHSVIDATVLPVDGEYWMVWKDERGRNEPSTQHKDLFLTRAASTSSFNTAWRENPTPPLTGPLCEGPALIRRGPEFGRDFVLLFDRFMEGSYGALRSDDGAEWEPVEASFPDLTRHAGVLEIEDELAERLQSTF